MWAIPTGISSGLKKNKIKNHVKSLSIMVSQPELGSDPPIESGRESGCDKLVSEPRFRRFWISLTLRMYLYSNVFA